MGASESTPTFFADGIRFTCTDCGNCCTGAPGLVRMSRAEMLTLADTLDLSPEACVENYLDPYESAYRIREKKNGDCIFFDQRCTIYTARPSQCRTYPFWFENMRSKAAWKATCRACPGIGEGRLYTEAEILACIHADMEAHESDAESAPSPGTTAAPEVQ